MWHCSASRRSASGLNVSSTFCALSPFQKPGPNAAAGSVVTVAVVTIANGGDNIGAYAPLFAAQSGIERVGTVALFTLLTGLWCWAAHRLIGPAGPRPPDPALGATCSALRPNHSGWHDPARCRIASLSAVAHGKAWQGRHLCRNGCRGQLERRRASRPPSEPSRFASAAAAGKALHRKRNGVGREH